MKASNAASASLLVSAIQISCNARLAFGCWLFGSLLRTLAVLCTQQRCSRVVGHSSPSAFQKPSEPSATARSGATARPRFFKSSSSSRQSCALSRAPSVKPSSSFLPSGVAPMMTRMHCLASSRRAWQVNTVGPHIDVVLGRQIALPPVLVLVDPDLLQPSNSRGRQSRCILAEQGRKRLLEIAGREALKVKDRDQHLQAPRAPRIRRQDRGCEADAPGIIGSATGAHAGVANPAGPV